MDEGAFILDYLTPAGTSLTETNRMLAHVEQILHNTPEVEITSRRTGLQLGLAAVTEANRGDFTVRLKTKRDRPIDEIMADVRARILKSEPALDIEFTQVLQDMIGDLSNQPEDIVIKLFSNDTALLNQLGPRVQAAIQKIPGVVDTKNGIDNTISGPATSFQVDPVVAARLGFTPTEVAEDATAILDGLPTTDPMIVNGRPYTVRIRLPQDTRASLDAIQNTVFNSAPAHTATLGSLAQVTQLPPQSEILRENLQQLITVTGRLEGSDLGTAMQQVRATVAGLHLPSSVRVEYGGTYEEQQKSFRDLARVLILALALVFGVLLAEFRNFSAPIAILTSSVLSIAGVVLALLDHRHHLQRRQLHGPDHGHRHRRQERHPAARRRREVRARSRRHSADPSRSHAAGRPAPPPPHPHDRHRRRLRNAPPRLRPRSRLADAATPGHRRHRRPASSPSSSPSSSPRSSTTASPATATAEG